MYRYNEQNKIINHVEAMLRIFQIVWEPSNVHNWIQTLQLMSRYIPVI